MILEPTRGSGMRRAGIISQYTAREMVGKADLEGGGLSIIDRPFVKI